MGHHSFLGEFEQTVMLAILQLGERAHAPEIAHISRRASTAP